jgi:CubicO group peptidase (beta-lactamase class C family)
MNRSSSLIANVDQAVGCALEERRIVGAVVIVARGGTIVYKKAHGFADRETLRPMRVDDVHRLASLTKPIVGVALLRLADRGAVELDGPVTRWLPDFRPRLADGDAPVITLRHLSTHTSGLGYRFAEPPAGPLHRLEVSDGLDISGITLDENLRRLSQAPLLFSPGQGWSYSLGFDVLGRVIELATGKDLEAALRELVTEPLGMNETSFLAIQPARLTTPYADAKPEPLRMPERYASPFGASAVDFSPGRATDATAYYSGGAGMVGTADDYIHFLEAVRTGRGSLLNEATRASLFVNAIGELLTLRGPGWGFAGIGAVLVDPATAHQPAHAGTIEWGGAWGNSWWIDPAAELSALIITNTAFEGMNGQLPADVRAAVYAARDA